MNYLRIRQTGFWAGNFIITTEDQSYSLGNKINTILNAEPYATGEILFYRDRKKPIVAFPLTINGLKVILEKAISRECRFWYDSLVVGYQSKIKTFKQTTGEFSYYTAEIDGNTKGVRW